ncbi:MAG TPA: HEAT repeat domain-containing protein, partial [Gemmataceae bacterium]|nr:HEAT repeat domain-containing protein [Gemmataceae bacterium]
MKQTFLIRLNQLDSSYLVLLSVAGIGIAAAIFVWTGLLGWVLRGLGHVVRHSIRRGFLLWERFFSGLSWLGFAVIVLGMLALGGVTATLLPMLTVVCALATLFMGLTTCLAYMFIEVERYQVERGYKAVHNPLKGQELAIYLVRFGEKVGVPLLAAAAGAMIGGFALLNQGLYETIGRAWYSVAEGQEQPQYLDFLAYALIHLLRIVDLLNLAGSHRLLEVSYVHAAAWPASFLLAAFQVFFTFILLEQIFTSIRQGNLLTEIITDFWSPHDAIHERALHALPQYGPRAILPLLVSLRSVASMTKEQRDQLPFVLAAFGPAAIPALVHHLRDPQEHMRAIAAAALGHLHAHDQVVLLAPLAMDPSDLVRQSLVEALGVIGASNPDQLSGLAARSLAIGPPWWARWKRRPFLVPRRNSIDLLLSTLQNALADDLAAVRTQAARALGRIGEPRPELARGLIAVLTDADETVRCEAAEALGKVGSAEESTVHALVSLLEDASPAVKTSASRALGSMKGAAASAVSALVALLQDQDQSVRTAAAEAIAQVGPLNGTATEKLVEGLASPDNVVRAQTAESLGTIGAPAQEAAVALVEAVADSNDSVRAMAVQALGKIGEGAAPVAVPSLVRALRDQDNWVSALAAEALGDMGEAADQAVPALIRALRHINPLVRANAAESLGKMAAVAPRLSLPDASGDKAEPRQSLNKACLDE